MPQCLSTAGGGPPAGVCYGWGPCGGKGFLQSGWTVPCVESSPGCWCRDPRQAAHVVHRGRAVGPESGLAWVWEGASQGVQETPSFPHLCPPVASSGAVLPGLSTENWQPPACASVLASWDPGHLFSGSISSSALCPRVCKAQVFLHFKGVGTRGSRSHCCQFTSPPCFLHGTFRKASKFLGMS